MDAMWASHWVEMLAAQTVDQLGVRWEMQSVVRSVDLTVGTSVGTKVEVLGQLLVVRKVGE